MEKKNVDMGFLSIAIDYFQVLSLVAASKVPWPEFIKDVFNFLSVFSFNIEITAPEWCASESETWVCLRRGEACRGDGMLR